MGNILKKNNPFNVILVTFLWLICLNSQSHVNQCLEFQSTQNQIGLFVHRENQFVNEVEKAQTYLLLTHLLSSSHNNSRKSLKQATKKIVEYFIVLYCSRSLFQIWLTDSEIEFFHILSDWKPNF